jgi:alpha-tubulin suppressor-like RCC1 family protein
MITHRSPTLLTDHRVLLLVFGSILVGCGDDAALMDDGDGDSTGAAPSSTSATPEPTTSTPSSSGATGSETSEVDETGASSSSTGGPADDTPPMLALTSPRDGRMTPVRQILVTGTVTDDVGVAALVHAGPDGEQPIEIADDGTFSATLPLEPGANAVTLVARDAAGNEAEAEVAVYFGHRISVGNSQAAFLRDGTLFTWGRNELGQLGNGTLDGSGYGDDPETSALPVRYEIPVAGLVSVVTRQTFMIALRDDGHVLTWGSNSNGQLGYETPADCGSTGDDPCQRSPTEVPGITDAIAVAAGFTHSLVLLRDGTVLAFGDNEDGQLGDETIGASSLEPIPVPGLADVVQLAASSDGTLALTVDGQVWAFGRNDRGQLGIGSADGEPHPAPVLVPGVAGAVSIAAANTTSYAQLDDGTMITWGRNHAGQAGTGAQDGADVLAPTAVVLEDLTALSALDAIAGDGFVGVALTSEPRVLAWGLGSLGQLGQGYLEDGERDLANRTFASPVAVAPPDESLFDVVEIEVGAGGPAMALTSEGNLFGWGWSFHGSLGLEGAIEAWAYSAPVLVFPAD